MPDASLSLRDYLNLNCSEELPRWLANFKQGNQFPRQDFFNSRVVFYPGSGIDAHPVRLFGSSHSAHCFLYADYSQSRKALMQRLDNPRQCFKGYHTLTRVHLRQNDLVNHWTSHVHPTEFNYAYASVPPFGFFEVLERDPDFDDEHGGNRLAILFLGADGIATYDALFCQANRLSAPFAALIQDHGFGGNYSSFGRNGLLEKIAFRTGVFPSYLLVAEDSQEWEGYRLIPGLTSDMGGMHGTARALYTRKDVSDFGGI